MQAPFGRIASIPQIKKIPKVAFDGIAPSSVTMMATSFLTFLLISYQFVMSCEGQLTLDVRVEGRCSRQLGATKFAIFESCNDSTTVVCSSFGFGNSSLSISFGNDRLNESYYKNEITKEVIAWPLVNKDVQGKFKCLSDTVFVNKNGKTLNFHVESEVEVVSHTMDESNQGDESSLNETECQGCQMVHYCDQWYSGEVSQVTLSQSTFSSSLLELSCSSSPGTSMEWIILGGNGDDVLGYDYASDFGTMNVTIIKSIGHTSLRISEAEVDENSIQTILCFTNGRYPRVAVAHREEISDPSIHATHIERDTDNITETMDKSYNMKGSVIKSGGKSKEQKNTDRKNGAANDHNEESKFCKPCESLKSPEKTSDKNITNRSENKKELEGQPPTSMMFILLLTTTILFGIIIINLGIVVFKLRSKLKQKIRVQSRHYELPPVPDLHDNPAYLPYEEGANEEFDDENGTKYDYIGGVAATNVHS